MKCDRNKYQKQQFMELLEHDKKLYNALTGISSNSRRRQSRSATIHFKRKHLQRVINMAVKTPNTIHQLAEYGKD